MTHFVKAAVMATLLAGVWGCSTKSSEEAAADARVVAADARVDAAAAVARVNAADAHVKAAEARVEAAELGAAAAAADARVANIDGRSASAQRVIPSGTVLKVILIDELNSEANSAGDHFLASIAEPVIVDGTTVLAKGTTVRGRVIGVTESGRVQGKAGIRLALTGIVQDGRIVAIVTDTFAATANDTLMRDAEIVGGGAAAGAVIGGMAGGKKGAGIGAITGGGAGAGVVLATKGAAIRYGPETRLNFTLTNSVEL
ncbi:MAG TPA: hypothetical protein VFY29_08535 [Terriglobia bacterium]|nr:hypothetical protein [Terriglobia bacterium]